MSIYSIYLSKLTNISEPIIGTPVLNRTNFKEKHTSGMFISTVPFKANVDSNITFSEFVTAAPAFLLNNSLVHLSFVVSQNDSGKVNG